MAPTGPHRFKTRFSNLPIPNFRRAPLISTPAALSTLPLPSVAHSIEAEPAPGVRSQHASLIVPIPVPGATTATDATPSPSETSGPATTPSTGPSSTDVRHQSTRRPPHSTTASDELETLRDSQYNTESEDEYGARGEYELSAEEMRQLDRLAMELEQGAHRGRPLSDPSDDGERDTVRSSYPINIDEWAVSPPPPAEKRREEKRALPPLPPLPVEEQGKVAVVRPAGTTKAAVFQVRLPRDHDREHVANGHSAHAPYAPHSVHSPSSTDLSRSNSFPRSKSAPRTTPRRSPPPPIIVAKEPSGTHIDASEGGKRRDSDDSVGVVIEDAHTYPTLSPVAGDEKHETGWETGSRKPSGRMQDAALDEKHGTRPKSILAAAGAAGKGVGGILKNVGTKSTQWVSGRSEGPDAPKQVRIATPRVAWSSSVLPSPGLNQRKSPAQLEFVIGSPTRQKKKRTYRLKKFKPWQNVSPSRDITDGSGASSSLRS